VSEFERIRGRLNPEDIRAQAERFSVSVFQNHFTHVVHRAYADFVDGFSESMPSPTDQWAVPTKYPNLVVRS
jgi:hypothetical protein